MIFTGWDTPLTLLRMELIQCDYEGHTVPEDLKEQVAALDDEQDEMNFEAVDALYRALDKVPMDRAFAYVQPNDLEGIREERPDGPRQLGGIAQVDLLDRFHGAWTGRAAGCALGKPVEGMGIMGRQGMRGRQASARTSPSWNRTRPAGPHWRRCRDARVLRTTWIGSKNTTAT